MASIQRTIIMQTLQEMRTHPTADEVYQQVKKRLPNISLGTVYRNLNQLVREGFAKRLGHAGEQTRFDANTDKHYHLICDTCGRIYDLAFNQISEINALMQNIDEHDVADYDLEFYGTCKVCKQLEKKHENA
jgi:Fe2+ or Zn2+ uptake regulation protein